MKRRILLSSVFFLGVSLCSVSYSQSGKTVDGTWKTITQSEIPVSGTRYIKPTKFTTMHLDVELLRQQLAGAKRITDPSYIPVFVKIPRADGTFGIYQVHENETMSEGLAAQFPEIRSYDGIPLDNSGEVVKFDLTPQGFHAMTLIPGQSTLFIDPYSFGGGDIEHYIVYSKADFTTDKLFSCPMEASLLTEVEENDPVKSFGNCTKRTYRLALSATGEYTTFQGGTVALAQAAQVTTMNRVNGDTPPSYSRHWPVPSLAMVLVTTLSRKVRSWLTRNTVPSYCCSNSSSSSSVSMSRSLVGSSSTSTLVGRAKRRASSRRLRSPPDRLRTGELARAGENRKSPR